MGYWDNIVNFHQRFYDDHPIVEEGFKAVKFLRTFFEKRGCESLSRNHPLHNRLGVGAEPNYLWLEQFAKKIQKVSSLSKFDPIAQRLVYPETFLAAFNEIEIGLKLYLEGLNVSFLNLDSEHTPDLILRLDNTLTRIEVSSLNPPDQETRFHRFLDMLIYFQMSREVVSGGYVNRIPSPNKLETIVNQVNEAINRAKETHKVEKVNSKGIVTIYVAPNDLVDQLPADCRGSFHFVGPPKPKPIENQIQQKIQKKSEQLFGENESGILFLYTLMINRKEVFQLFKTDMDDIIAILASYPKLLGLVLTVPHYEIGVVSMSKPVTLKSEYKKNKILLESEAGQYQSESIIIWKNLHANFDFPDKIINALKNYSSNLSNLEPLNLCD